MKNEMRITYPRTEYLPINRNIGRYISNLIEEFMQYGEITIGQDFIYSMDTYYEEYQYNEYLSYVIKTEMSTGGAHPDHRIYTVTYNTRKNRFINIENLVKKNKNILNLLSEESRKILKTKEDFMEGKFEEDMFLEGTRPTLENFDKIAFSKDGLAVYFPEYQIAPYYKGEYKIIIPYQNLDLDESI